ncbi:hypothetical protein MYK68_07860 [Gordonia sp. PP30]|uniref:hypothetical protein n=1 Tax=Gordonia sp. PP30 TaxID=2935861 RepID=UPI002000096D|nr:hypothetical protein [Gordonia sp. PP30]UQE76472.1 hypothetical protein MYK68_07860 [Gordonia sp. PP30]
MLDIVRPQPLGAFTLPAGLLLIAGEDSEPVRCSLLAGRRPQDWPESLEGQRLVHAGRIEEAIGVFAADRSPVGRFNLFVLAPDRITREEVAAALGEQWRPLVDYVAFTAGLTSVPPSPSAEVDEIAALLATAEAAACLDEGDSQAAIGHLVRAAEDARGVHPAFAGVILSEVAARAHSLAAAEEAVALLKDTDLTSQYAEALYQHAGLVHGLAIDGRRPIGQAISGYTAALRLINEREDRPLFARVHMNLGIAILAQPMLSADDQLRAGVAVQSLRTAVRLLDRDNDAEEWASARLNLANALVYAPSGRQRDNIMEAVDLYEQVLRTRTAKKDPLGRARVLANQGNALGHLGLLPDATARLEEAAYLFAAQGDEDSAQMVREMTGQLSELVS